MIALDIDPKGLSDREVQTAVDRFIAENNQRAWRRQYEHERQERIANGRVAQGKRLRLVNAIKRGKVSVRTQESWRSGQVEVPRTPIDGWYYLTLIPMSYNRQDTPEKRAEYDKALAFLVKRLQENAEIELDIETKLESVPSWYEDQTPKLTTYYKARLVVDIDPEEGN